ncbi:MAG: YdbL family protein [Nitrospirota bacterium]|nr:YdbL family protein [Nitrospirota bacterium]
MTRSNQHPQSLAMALGCILLFLMPLLAFGVTLDEAKQQGLLGERPDGYLGLAKTPASPDTVNLMKDINRKRRDVYKGIAKKNGTALSAVEALAGKKAIEKTPSGQFIMQPNGTWTPKH